MSGEEYVIIDGRRIPAFAGIGATDPNGNAAANTVATILSNLGDSAADEFLETSFTIDGSESVAYTLEVSGLGAYSGMLMTAIESSAGDGTIVRMHSVINGQAGTVYAGQPIASGAATNSFAAASTYRIPIGSDTIQFKAQASPGVNATTGEWTVHCIFHKNPGYFYLG